MSSMPQHLFSNPFLDSTMSKKKRISINPKDEDCLMRLYQLHSKKTLRSMIASFDKGLHTKYWNKSKLIRQIRTYPTKFVFELWSLAKIREVLTVFMLPSTGTKKQCLQRLCDSIHKNSFTRVLSPSVSFSTQNPICILPDNHSIEINCIPDDSVFPAGWIKPPINATYTTIKPSNFPQFYRAATFALRKYPTSILQHLQYVHFFKTMSFYQLSFGGTYYKNSIYIVDYYKPKDIERAIHHEFSSIVRVAYGIPRLLRRWNRILPPDFTYGDGGIDALKSGATSCKPDRALWKKGIFCEYASASPEEDFNVIAEELWTGCRELWEGAQDFPVLYKKIKLVIDVYADMNASCDESYFLSLVN
jgi:hypothetical protein